MKKTLKTILIFAIVLAACLGLAELVDWLMPETEPVQAAADQPVIVTNVMDAGTATLIELSDAGVSITGIGADVTDEGVKIVYPGTYRITGVLTDGQILVDCDTFHGGVYLMLDGADISCSTGPAIHVKQSEKTVLYLVEGSENRLQDGLGYTITESQEISTGGAVYCDDDLYIEGSGVLTVVGNNADGIRSKDGLTLSGGMVTVTAADDGIQGSDYVEILNGTVSVTAAGDGIACTKGNITLTDGVVTVLSEGDGLAATADVELLGGSLSVTTYGGAENYDAMAVNGLSAKGVKGVNVTVSGGTYVMNTADDAMHGDVDLAILGGDLRIRSGDDAVSAGQELSVAGGNVIIETGYEGLEAATVAISGGNISIWAENDGVDALAGFTMTGGVAAIRAPQCVSTDAVFLLQRGTLYLATTEMDTVMKFAEGSVTGGTLIATGTGTADEFLSGGALPASLLFVLPAELAAGSELALWDADGSKLLSAVTEEPAGLVLVASGALGLGQEYTFTAGEWSAKTVLAEENTIVR